MRGLPTKSNSPASALQCLIMTCTYDYLSLGRCAHACAANFFCLLAAFKDFWKIEIDMPKALLTPRVVVLLWCLKLFRMFSKNNIFGMKGFLFAFIDINIFPFTCLLTPLESLIFKAGDETY